jgi:hypothetical protein
MTSGTRMYCQRDAIAQPAEDGCEFAERPAWLAQAVRRRLHSPTLPRISERAGTFDRTLRFPAPLNQVPLNQVVRTPLSGYVRGQIHDIMHRNYASRPAGHGV